MPLKLATFNVPHVAILNRWADAQENQMAAHQQQIQNLQGQIAQLLKANPSIVNPTQK